MALPFDYGDAVAYGLAACAVVAGHLFTKRSKSTEHNVNETVDGGVLTQFLRLNDRLTKLELELQQTRQELNVVRKERDTQIADALRDKNYEIASLRTSLENHRKRIKQLEDK